MLMALTPQSEVEQRDLLILDGARAIVKKNMIGVEYLLLVKDESYADVKDGKTGSNTSADSPRGTEENAETGGHDPA
jgi:hypothetical protein